jgi:hypothetical protein
MIYLIILVIFSFIIYFFAGFEMLLILAPVILYINKRIFYKIISYLGRKNILLLTSLEKKATIKSIAMYDLVVLATFFLSGVLFVYAITPSGHSFAFSPLMLMIMFIYIPYIMFFVLPEIS